MNDIGPRLDRRSINMGALAAPFVSWGNFAKHSNKYSLPDFGGCGDGRTDNANALRRAFDWLGPGGVLSIPAGRFLVLDRSLQQGQAELSPPPGFRIEGQGADSVLAFRKTVLPSFYGLSIRSEGIRISNVTLEIERSGDGWAVIASPTGLVRDLRFVDVSLRGVGGRTGLYGVLPLGADLRDLSMLGCRFSGLDFGFARQTTDIGTYNNLAFDDCEGDDCTEVIEINAPGLRFFEAQEGSLVINRVLDEAGMPLDAREIAVGRELRGIFLEPGTMVTGHDEHNQLRISKPVLRAGDGQGRSRFSTGGAIGGRIRNLTVRNIGQWAVGLANCTDWDVEVRGERIGYELVHVEDNSQNIRIKAGGRKCNLKPGVVGSPGADNGMVHISTGSHDVRIRMERADLTGNKRGRVAGICVQPGGAMGTTGAEVAPRGISLGGQILLREGVFGVIAYESELRFDGLELISPILQSPADPTMKLPGCAVSGSVVLRNPGKHLLDPDSKPPTGRLESTVFH